MRKSAFGPPRAKNMKGFTIIEVLISMGLMSIGLLAVAAMQISAVRNNKTGNTYTQAAALARAQMELIKNGDINDITDPLNPNTFPGTNITNDPNNPVDENGQAGGIYNLSWTIAPYYDDTDGSGDIDPALDTVSRFARTVTVTVSFPFVGWGTRQVSLSSVTTGGVMMPNHKRYRLQTGILSDSGFTLIELLIAMAIASIVLAAVISVYTGLSRSYTTETARAKAQQDIRSGMALMAQDIRLANLDPLGTAGGGITLNSPTDIEVIADLNYDGALTPNNMEQIRYFLSGNQLIQELDGVADIPPIVLVDNVGALNFTVTLDDDGITPLMVVINMTVVAPAGRTGTITRTLTEQVKIRN